MHPLTAFNGAEPLTPKQMGRLVAESLVTALPGTWSVTADGIRSDEAGQRTDIILQRGRASRKDVGVWITPRLVVTDAGLVDWSGRNEQLIDGPVDGRIFNSLFVNFTRIWEVFVSRDYSPPAGAVSFDEFLSILIDDVLPKRELLRSPETLTELPDRWLGDVERMLLWSVSVGRADLCWPLVDRSLGRVPKQTEPGRKAFMRGILGQERGEDASRSNGFESLGHLIGRLRQHVDLGQAPSWLTPTYGGESRPFA